MFFRSKKRDQRAGNPDDETCEYELRKPKPKRKKNSEIIYDDDEL